MKRRWEGYCHNMNFFKRYLWWFFKCYLKGYHYFAFSLYEDDDWDETIFRKVQPCHVCGKMIPNTYERTFIQITRLRGNKPPP